MLQVGGGLIAVVLCVSAGAATPAGRAALPLDAAAIPPRPTGAPTGTQFAAEVDGLSVAERSARGADQLLAGNVPYAQRTLWPVVLGGRMVVWVMGDYLAIGSDDDALAWPLDLPSAARVALAWGYALPTAKIVDAIAEQATYRTEPLPLPPTDRMDTVSYLLQHNRMLLEQRIGGWAPGLCAGSKKDLVLTPRLAGRPHKEAIYGWHRLDGTPIQPLSTWHVASWADYSHGLRLVYDEVLVDGAPMSLWKALADPELSKLLSDEGPIERGPSLLRAAIVFAEQAAAEAAAEAAAAEGADPASTR